ncbi:virion structural protein [Pseudomonas phage Phabio]|uniref:Virion structural protein n=1 Tax=Pseudomonas phage Phabio TaxID=2006668 RepID=A0A1Y0STF6_9CAUD|nr:virion structural protein [Pseudomonas phage Phabio]ARV76761.1 virion structural protein [Pseudomonas phage Phabio]
MRLGYEISRLLKEVNSDTANVRAVRALMVANAVAFFVPVDPTKNQIENVEEHIPLVKKIAGQINENIALDTKLALELYRKAMFIRCELITGVSDPAIIATAMRSHAAEMHQTDAETVLANALTSNLDFMRLQGGIQSVLAQNAAEV